MADNRQITPCRTIAMCRTNLVQKLSSELLTHSAGRSKIIVLDFSWCHSVFLDILIAFSNKSCYIYIIYLTYAIFLTYMYIWDCCSDFWNHIWQLLLKVCFLHVAVCPVLTPHPLIICSYYHKKIKQSETMDHEQTVIKLLSGFEIFDKTIFQ